MTTSSTPTPASDAFEDLEKMIVAAKEDYQKAVGGNKAAGHQGTSSGDPRESVGNPLHHAVNHGGGRGGISRGGCCRMFIVISTRP
jgi:hypothetical protein